LNTAVLRPTLFKCRNFQFDFSQNPCIMGVLNVTPDSFSDGGKYLDKDFAVEHALKMEQEGAGIIDIGAQSTRPGAEKIDASLELERIEKIVQILVKKLAVPVSIDTSSSIVAERCLELGASIINDVYALRGDEKLGSLIARYKAGVVLMHMRENPQTMQENPQYKDVIEDIINYLKDAKKKALGCGISRESIMVDPGIGFGKTTEHNLKILKFLNEFEVLECPILVGTSRKSFIGNALDAPVNEREFGTAASVVISVLNGASVVRVHSVKQMQDAIKITQAITRQGL